ncbi:hypothetical protein EJ04DRAFT_221011 [Polyplosphaeria fusca]|uniref:Uncharacterized protein n=1 Tax=Polyplosphaeria fusca TaxID=682080 RepID=A0A9P4R167_9PLEO|nr:hypothetical protein EJ04DRAFT_221011 [Polyplosphaeria fusca]
MHLVAAVVAGQVRTKRTESCLKATEGLCCLGPMMELHSPQNRTEDVQRPARTKVGPRASLSGPPHDLRPLVRTFDVRQLRRSTPRNLSPHLSLGVRRLHSPEDQGGRQVFQRTRPLIRVSASLRANGTKPQYLGPGRSPLHGTISLLVLPPSIGVSLTVVLLTDNKISIF